MKYSQVGRYYFNREKTEDETYYKYTLLYGGAYVLSYIARYSYISKDLKEKILCYLNTGISSSIQDIYYHDGQATIAIEFKDDMNFLYLERKIPEKYKYLFKEMKKGYIS